MGVFFHFFHFFFLSSNVLYQDLSEAIITISCDAGPHNNITKHKSPLEVFWYFVYFFSLLANLASKPYFLIILNSLKPF